MTGVSILGVGGALGEQPDSTVRIEQGQPLGEPLSFAHHRGACTLAFLLGPVYNLHGLPIGDMAIRAFSKHTVHPPARTKQGHVAFVQRR